MALSNRCSVCSKGAGTCYCPGCKTYFCDKDFKNHRTMLFNKLEELTTDRNELREKLNGTSTENHSDSILLSGIDAWEKETILKVKKAANQTREQVLKIINSKQEELNELFERLSQELERLRETEGVLEGDLSRLKNHIEQINESLHKLSESPTIWLNIKQSEKIDWNSMIYVENSPTSSAPIQREINSQGGYVASF